MRPPYDHELESVVEPGGVDDVGDLLGEQMARKEPVPRFMVSARHSHRVLPSAPLGFRSAVMLVEPIFAFHLPLSKNRPLVLYSFILSPIPSHVHNSTLHSIPMEYTSIILVK